MDASIREPAPRSRDSISQPHRIIVPDPKAGYPAVGEPPTEGPVPEGAPFSSLGPLLLPGALPDEEEEPEPAAEEPEPVEAPPPPGGELGAAVAAALQAALERTGEVPPAQTSPAGQFAVPPTPAEPLDLLDTSSAPWLHDPELGVQWAESWIASHPGEELPEEPEPAAEPSAGTVPAAELPPTPEPPAPPPPERASPPVVQLPAVVESLAPPVAAAAPVFASPPAPVAPEPLPPRLRPYEPRSLEMLLGHAPAPQAASMPAPVTSVPEPAARPEPAREAVAHRDWVKALGIGLVLGVLAGLVAYAVGPAANEVHLTRYDVPVNGLPSSLDGLRIVQVSDLHLPGRAARADSAARLVARARPDVLLLTGDIIDDAAPATLAALDRFLATARGGQGTFAVTGEREAELRAPLVRAYEAHGVRLLANQRAALHVGDATLVIVGVDGSPERRLQVTPARAGIDAMPTLLRPRVELLMIHAPQLLADVPHADLKDAAFVVAGHTLGGPLGLPSPFDGQSRYRSGWYSLDLTRLYVSNGVGTGRIPARLLAPAEVTRFTLRRASAPYATPTRDTTRE
jgi:predicted MPP superfamily phosphohydrolase